MLAHPTVDNLMALRLPAFAAAYQRQLGNPDFTALSFEDRLPGTRNRKHRVAYEPRHDERQRVEHRAEADNRHLASLCSKLPGAGDGHRGDRYEP